jgi:integrase
MTEEQETGLLAACTSNLLLRTVVSLALNTALRKNEIRTLHWQQIDLIQRTLTVGRTKTEGGSGRTIPLNSVAYGALVRWASRFPEAKPEDYVFPSGRPRESSGSTRTRSALTRVALSNRGDRHGAVH